MGSSSCNCQPKRISCESKTMDLGTDRTLSDTLRDLFKTKPTSPSSFVVARETAGENCILLSDAQPTKESRSRSLLAHVLSSVVRGISAKDPFHVAKRLDQNMIDGNAVCCILRLNYASTTIHYLPSRSKIHHGGSWKWSLVTLKIGHRITYVLRTCSLVPLYLLCSFVHFLARISHRFIFLLYFSSHFGFHINCQMR